MHVARHVVEALTMLHPICRRQNLRFNILELLQNFCVCPINAYSFLLSILLIKGARSVLCNLLGFAILVEAFLLGAITSEDFVDAAEELLVADGKLLPVVCLRQVLFKLHGRKFEPLDELVVNTAFHI